MTICVECRHYHLDLPGCGPGRLFVQHRCKSPALSSEAIDFVTGEKTVAQHLCRVINAHGDCPHFQAKEEMCPAST